MCVVIPHLARALDHQIVSITQSVAQRKDIKPAYDTAATVMRVLMNQANLQLSAIADAILLDEYAAFSGVDDLLDKILMDGNSGSPLDAHDLERVLRTGINRFSNGIPPGYKDVHKLDNRPKADALGDLIFWEEILRIASCQVRPIIIVTAEEKEDWWHRYKGLRQSHPAMVSEMKGRSNQDFGCMHVDDFTSLNNFKRRSGSTARIRWLATELVRRRRHDADIRHRSRLPEQCHPGSPAFPGSTTSDRFSPSRTP